jgi:hypothetical protein
MKIRRLFVRAVGIFIIIQKKKNAAAQSTDNGAACHKQFPVLLWRKSDTRLQTDRTGKYVFNSADANLECSRFTDGKIQGSPDQALRYITSHNPEIEVGIRCRQANLLAIFGFVSQLKQVQRQKRRPLPEHKLSPVKAGLIIAGRPTNPEEAG